MSTTGIDLMNAEIAQLTANKVSLQSNLSTNEASITALQAISLDLNNQIAVIDTKIANLTADIARLNT